MPFQPFFKIEEKPRLGQEIPIITKRSKKISLYQKKPLTLLRTPLTFFLTL